MPEIMRAIPVFVTHLEDPAGSGRAACNGVYFESVYGAARHGDTLWTCTGCTLVAMRLQDARKELLAERRRADLYRRVFWDIAVICGMDTDGATGPEAITHPGMDEIALREVEELRAAYDECEQASAEAEREFIAREVEGLGIDIVWCKQGHLTLAELLDFIRDKRVIHE